MDDETRFDLEITQALQDVRSAQGRIDWREEDKLAYERTIQEALEAQSIALHRLAAAYFDLRDRYRDDRADHADHHPSHPGVPLSSGSIGPRSPAPRRKK